MAFLFFCRPSDDWEHYNSFVCAAWIPNTPNTNWGQQRFPNDLGPIAWPSTGYLQTNGEKFTCGVNTPSSIKYNGYLYLFFHDDGQYGSAGSPPFYPPPEEENRHEGITVARAPVADALEPKAWQVFCRDPAGVYPNPGKGQYPPELHARPQRRCTGQRPRSRQPAIVHKCHHRLPAGSPRTGHRHQPLW